jgi:hypothetical protein
MTISFSYPLIYPLKYLSILVAASLPASTYCPASHHSAKISPETISYGKQEKGTRPYFITIKRGTSSPFDGR